jgi:endo-1,4-beta-xylanase
MQAKTIVRAAVFSIAIPGLSLSSAQTQTRILAAAFTPAPIQVDGKAEDAWSAATPSDIAICMNPRRTARLSDCKVSGNVRALWNGPMLYLLFTVTDPEVTTTAAAETARSGVQVFVDQYDDKFPKFEEDDGYVVISAAGQQTGNVPNANLPYYPTVWSTHLQSYAAATRTESGGNRIGYTVEIGWSIGDRPLKNGTKLGMEFVINAPAGVTNPTPYLLSWSSGTNKGVNDNTMWGDVTLAGYDGKAPMELNTFPLQQSIRKATASSSSATGLVRGIWTDESRVDRALAAANTASQKAVSQAELDAANTTLEAALSALRRSGRYPDPEDLPSLKTLPDPFTFFKGAKVRSVADWDKRRAEIRDLAQYYEFGEMPPPPQSLTAISSTDANSATTRSIAVTVTANGKTAFFAPILHLPPNGTAPYPVIVEESFRASAAPNRAFLDGGYAVLSIPTSDSQATPGIASDNGNHTGAFYTLYPYKLDRDGDDRGVLLAWAWGASRGVDALEYLAAQDPTYVNLLDLKKLVVTGFSRWGKAALLAGFLDDRFQVTAPGGSGSGGAAPYRYDSFGNQPARDAPYGDVYPWGQSTGSEAMGDHIRHQTHNSNEMIRRFLNEPRIYKTSFTGYGERLPFDHHMMIAAIAPRAVIINNTNDDYADNAEGDSIGYEGAKPVFQFLGAAQNLALDIFMGGGGHSLKPSQAANIVSFANFVLFGRPLPDDVRKHLATDPYLDAGTYDRYYGGLKRMMPWGNGTH